MAEFKKTKVSGPFKSFLEGLAGCIGVFALFMLYGAYLNDALAVGVMITAGLGALSAILFKIASLIPSKRQYTEK
ncbi:hypothetical protein [uncultured Roseobacter sp.]|uniref:hypothetical protein n=1 Tax=uncultured Roseobacter sp. TaxID=114847 RepID=UPI0026372691|nr:hypothetical protein [uncultured Roseobacter sp.]